MSLPHFAWPFELGVTVEQDSFEELQASAAVILCTERGDRIDVPEFGVTNPLFGQVPADTERLAAELEESDPRLSVEVSDVSLLIDATAAYLRVDLSGKD